MTSNTKESLLEEMENSREAFLNFIEAIDIAEYHLPLAMPGESPAHAWSIRDILLHISRWEAELIKFLWQIEQGQKPSPIFFLPDDKVDELNELWHREGLSRPLEFVLDDFHGVRNQTILRLEGFSDQDLFAAKRYPWIRQGSLGDIVANNTCLHEQEHLQTIVTWKKQRT